MAEDGDSLGGRLGRYARVGASVGGLAARLAGERYLGLALDRDKHASELKSALGGLKGPLMKAAQLLATIPDALPPEYARELAQLQANAPAMGWAFVRRRMASELGPDWQAKFRKFDKEASFAASLGQVHHAVLPASHPSGAREVACKLQYPDMASALEADLNQLKLVFAVGQRFDPAIRTDEIHAEITNRLREELDYRREARHVALYRHLLRDEPAVHVPDVVADYSTDRLLTMGWLAGEPLLNWKAHAQEEKDQLAIEMFRAWYVPFYSYGVIHGDPHLGNYTVRADGSVNLMDFGCVRIFPPRFVRGSIELYRALMTDDLDRAVAAYEDWGFSGLTRDMIAVLNRWAAFLYGPLMDDRPRRLTEGMAEGHGRDMAHNVFSDLRKMGGVRPPREFVFMDRAAIGLGSVFIHLRASINWHRLFEELIEGFTVEALTARQDEALGAAGLK
jgi:predicted unusual protein kinase regulating ubiquinone biosynthesis (AarF/ABC1/UbiB family)